MVEANDNPKSCEGCRYDSKRFLCLHPDEHKPEFWHDDRVIDGRPWCYEAGNKEKSNGQD